MLAFILFMLATYAMSSIIVEQHIFDEVRDWIKQCSTEATNPNWFQNKVCQLISCMFCTGVWCGAIINLLGLNIFNTGSFDFFF
jgi:hypothetical protein